MLGWSEEQLKEWLVIEEIIPSLQESELYTVQCATRMNQSERFRVSQFALLNDQKKDRDLVITIMRRVTLFVDGDNPVITNMNADEIKLAAGYSGFKRSLVKHAFGASETKVRIFLTFRPE